MAQYTLQPETIQRSLQRLLNQPIHHTFVYYLSLQQQSAIDKSSSNLPLPYQKFLESYFRIGNPGSSTPYFVPFTDSKENIEQELSIVQDEIYSLDPSTLPTSSPLMKIATVDTKDSEPKWELMKEHWKVASHELCSGNKVPIESLSAYLFRDYAFKTDNPSAVTVVRTFTNEFGYELGGKAFSHLYQTGDSNISEGCFEEYE
ncbi:hypothetical protein KM295_15040 [Natronomonas sp. F2-12]|uniref:Uncharacterized protein n=1 Tax=Natronomonas aquatica TaxID=2841590 RepID=A0A9R1D7G5_9EURY|nr:hypothetical protein [Natronomonas aquatica]MCQ4334768.1 hypothetical protein [Natronomonas aquatica]